MTKGANIGLRLRPFTETKIVQLALKTCKLFVLEKLSQNFIFETAGIEEFDTRAIGGPRYNRRIFYRQNLAQLP
jgi:hypothetical protein